jgi:ribosomal protein S18 acetylase RimI-like enzyme
MTPELERHFYEMALDLIGRQIEEPALPNGFTLEPMAISSLSAYGRIVARAYAGDHVDHQPDDDDPALAAQVLEQSLRGDDLGPWLPSASFHIRCDDGPIVAAIVICNRPHNASNLGGPWISDVFVDPTFAGHGLCTALTTRAAKQLIEDGHTRLGLAVTNGNPAIRVYERVGFRIEREVRRFRPTTPTGGRS